MIDKGGKNMENGVNITVRLTSKCKKACVKQLNWNTDSDTQFLIAFCEIYFDSG